MATYVHTGRVPDAYSRIRTARAHVHGWVGTEKQHHRRVHGDPTGWVGTECVVVFIGRAWTEQPMETRPGIPQNGGNGLVFDRPRSKRDPVHREGPGVPQNGVNGPPTVEMGVMLIGRGVSYYKTDETDLCWSTTFEMGGGVWRTAKRDSTGYCSSPPSTSSSLHGLPSASSSLHGLLFIQLPPRATPSATVQPPLHGLLFIQPYTVYCTSCPPAAS